MTKRKIPTVHFRMLFSSFVYRDLGREYAPYSRGKNSGSYTSLNMAKIFHAKANGGFIEMRY